MKERNEIFKEEYKKYTEVLKGKLRTLPKGSKLWWRLNRELLHNTPCRQATPSLKNSCGEWVHDAKQKVELFKQIFDKKAKLPPEPEKGFDTSMSSAGKMPRFTMVRTR